MKQGCAHRWATAIRASARPVRAAFGVLVVAALLPLLGAQAAAVEEPAGSAPSRSDQRFDVPLTEVDAEEVQLVAANRMLLAIDAIAELGGFDRAETPGGAELLVAIRDGVPADGLDGYGYAMELELFVDDFLPYLASLEASGQTVSDDVWEAAGALDDVVNGSFDPLADEPPASDFLSPRPWLRGLADMLVRNGAPLDSPSPDAIARDQQAIAELLATYSGTTIDLPNPPLNPLQPGVPPTPSTTTPSARPLEADDSDATTTGRSGEEPSVLAFVRSGAAEPPVETGPNLPLMIAGGVVVAGSIAGAAISRRRPRHRSSHADSVLKTTPVAPDVDTTIESTAPSVVELLDASRRMSSTLDATAVAETALREVKKLIAAYGGLVVRRSPEGALHAIHCDPLAVFDLDKMEGSLVERVALTGRATAAVASDDPVLIDTPMAVAAAPIIAEAAVTGVMMVVRHSTRPFDRTELDALELFAPLVGSAFVTAETHQSATHLVDVEPLTGLLNRRRLDLDLSSIDVDDQVAYVMVDVDHFKNFNDSNGHAAGDHALKTVAMTLQAAVRPSDSVYRYGGEEFCVLLPGATAEEAAVVAERAREAVAAAHIPGMEAQPEGCVTVSVGVSDSAWATPTGLVEHADAALYESKRNGRNRVTIGSA